jgi:hypothetical protein
MLGAGLALSGCDASAAALSDAAVVDATAPRDASALVANDAGVADGRAPGSPPIVLFIGNSYTSRNDLPSVVRALGAATPHGAVEVRSVLVDGAHLADQWNTTGARAMVEAGGLDVVVVQGQSVEPITRGDDFQHYAALFADAIHTAGARPVWFATWARRAGDPFYEPWGGYPGLMTDVLETAYETAAHPHADVVARVGRGWQIGNDGVPFGLPPLPGVPGVVLYDADGSHPSPAGTLLTACVLLHVITGELPQLPDPPPLGVAPDVARSLCAIAPMVECNSVYEHPCGGVCVDARWDRANCGACGAACPGTLSCVDGVCGCPLGRTRCGDACVDVTTDRANCGGCGASCGVGGPPCFGGVCGCPAAQRRDLSTSVFTALRPACTPWDASATAECASAAHEYCASQECFASGFGPLLGSGAAVCVADAPRSTTYGELARWVAACDGTTERSGPDCSAAIHRYCVSLGAATGFGPVESAGDAVTITCLAHATIVHTDFAALTGSFSGCDGTTTRWGQPCIAASWFTCGSLGHGAGFGPVETAGDSADIACVDL